MSFGRGNGARGLQQREQERRRAGVREWGAGQDGGVRGGVRERGGTRGRTTHGEWRVVQ